MTDASMREDQQPAPPSTKRASSTPPTDDGPIPVGDVMRDLDLISRAKAAPPQAGRPAARLVRRRTLERKRPTTRPPEEKPVSDHTATADDEIRLRLELDSEVNQELLAVLRSGEWDQWRDNLADEADTMTGTELRDTIIRLRFTEVVYVCALARQITEDVDDMTTEVSA